LGTGNYTFATARAFFIINAGNAVFSNFDGSKGTVRLAVSIAIAAPGAQLGTSGGKFCRATGWNAHIVAFFWGLVLRSLTAQNRYHIFGGNAYSQDSGKDTGNFAATYRTFIRRRVPSRYSLGVGIAARKTTGAAIRARQGFTDGIDFWIALHFEFLLKKAQARSNDKSQNYGNSKRYKYY
jgi:hypothetical protein